MALKRVCVFCGSSPGSRPEYTEAAAALGRALVNEGIGLVYGGGKVGLMGVVAATVMEAGGEAIGVIPRDLVDREVAYRGVTDLRIVGSMHERKALMAGLSDGFIALPGGLGTVEEFFEVVTWAQLGIHQKPCGLLNTSGYYDRVIDFLDHAVGEQFIAPAAGSLVLVEEDPVALLKKFNGYRRPKIDKAAWALGLTNKKVKT